MKKSKINSWYVAGIFLNIAFLIALLLIPSCSDDETRRKNYKNNFVTVSNANVEVKYSRAYKLNDKQYIENKNDFPVKIRAVWQYRGEQTFWFRQFEAYEKRFDKKERDSLIKEDVLYIGIQTAFYIYDMDGKLIGFVKAFR